MTDFFSALRSGIQGPDVVMQEGPLPPTNLAGMPAGFNGDPDGRINFNATLLGDLNPYAYGKPARISSQTAYLNVPHRVQRIIPEITIPTAQPTRAGGDFFRLSHQVQDGDCAFVIRCMFSPFELVSDKKKFARQGALFAIDPICNLATVNYILHGLQRYGYDKRDGKNWHTLWVALGIDDYFYYMLGKRKLSEKMLEIDNELKKVNIKLRPDPYDKFKFTEKVSWHEMSQRLNIMIEMRQYRKLLCEYLIKNVITPLGVPAGSDKQGGQHQGIYNSAVTWPVDFVTSMVIDGKVINLLNFWKHDDVSAGDDLMMYLSEGSSTTYTLSHHAKSRRTEMFEPLQKWELPRGIADADGLSDQRCNILKRIWDLFGRASVAYEPGKKDKNPMPDHGMQDKTKNREGPGMHVKDGNREPSTISTVDRESAEKMFEEYLKLTTPDDASLLLLLNQLVTDMGITGAVNFAAGISFLRGELERPENRKSKLSPFEEQRIRVVDESIFQLTPGVKSSTRNAVLNALWRNGYWHIARSQVMHYKYDEDADIRSGANCMNRGKMLEATFAPVWMNGYEADPMGNGPPVASGFSEDRYDMGGKGIKRARGKSEVVGTVERVRLLAAELRRVVNMWQGMTEALYADKNVRDKVKGEYERFRNELQGLAPDFDKWQKDNPSDTVIKGSIALSFVTHIRSRMEKQYFPHGIHLAECLTRTKNLHDILNKSSPFSFYSNQYLPYIMRDFAEFIIASWPKVPNNYYAFHNIDGMSSQLQGSDADKTMNNVMVYYTILVPLQGFYSEPFSLLDVNTMLTNMKSSNLYKHETIETHVRTQLSAKRLTTQAEIKTFVTELFKDKLGAVVPNTFPTGKNYKTFSNIQEVGEKLKHYSEQMEHCQIGTKIKITPIEPHITPDPSRYAPRLSEKVDGGEEVLGASAGGAAVSEESTVVGERAAVSEGATLATVVEERAATVSLSQPATMGGKKNLFRAKSAKSTEAPSGEGDN